MLNSINIIKSINKDKINTIKNTIKNNTIKNKIVNKIMKNNTDSVESATITDKLYNLYKNKGYFDMYGGSIGLTILLLIVFSIIVSYFFVMSNVKYLRANWNANKCNPSVIPFAGLVNKDPHMSALEFTSQNFHGCVTNILTAIAGDAFKPIEYTVHLIHTMMEDSIQSVQFVREKISSVVSNFESIDRKLMGKMSVFMIPIQEMLVKMKDIMRKSVAVVITNIFTIVTGYLGMKSFIGAFVQAMIGGLVALIAIIVPLMLFIFTAPLAAPFLVAFSIVAGYVLALTLGLRNVINISPSMIPAKPHIKPFNPFCFDGNTLIELECGEKVPIKYLKLNSILNDGGRVTSLLKLKKGNNVMYNYNGVIVSGGHQVLENWEWKEVYESDYGIELDIEQHEDKYIYCINTTTHKVIINNTVFADWDTIISGDEAHKINNKISRDKECGKVFDVDFPEIITSLHIKNQLHTLFESCLHGNTLVVMSDGQTKPLKHVRVNDSLAMGSHVLGITKVSTKDIQLYKYNINGCTVIGSKNCIYHVGFGKHTTLNDYDNPKKNNIKTKQRILYDVTCGNKKTAPDNHQCCPDDHLGLGENVGVGVGAGVGVADVGVDLDDNNTYYQLIVDDGMYMIQDNDGHSLIVCDYNQGLDYFLSM